MTDSLKTPESNDVDFRTLDSLFKNIQFLYKKLRSDESFLTIGDQGWAISYQSRRIEQDKKNDPPFLQEFIILKKAKDYETTGKFYDKEGMTIELMRNAEGMSVNDIRVLISTQDDQGEKYQARFNNTDATRVEAIGELNEKLEKINGQLSLKYADANKLLKVMCQDQREEVARAIKDLEI